MSQRIQSASATLNGNDEPTAVAAIGSPKKVGLPAPSRAAPFPETDLSKAALARRRRAGVPEADAGKAALASRRSNLNQWQNALCLLLGDILAFVAAVAVAGIIAYAVNVCLLGIPYLAFEEPGLVQQFIVMACVAAGVCAWFARAGHYTERRLFRTDLGEILEACILGLLINGFVEYANKTSFSRLWLALVWIFAAISITFGRVACRSLLNAFGMWKVNAVIIGRGVHALTVKDSISKDDYFGYRVGSDVALAPHTSQSHWPNEEFDDLEGLLQETNAHCIILVPADDEMPYLGGVIDSLNVRMIPYKIVPPIDRLPLAGLTTQSFLSSDAVLMTVQVGLASPLSQLTKRLFDIVASSLLLVGLSPLLLIVGLAVAADGGPIFFEHERVGRRGKLFNCLKFRTMVPNADEVLEHLLARDPKARREWQTTRKLREDPRNTRLGRGLRASSIDELPQLFNVLRGEMSLVGPRPVVQQELSEHYKSDNSYYLLVRPGVTGLWQTSGRSSLDYEQRVHLDTWYVRNWSLWGDLMILARTVPAVIGGRGAY
jgi:Undecaprenyl-phosphate galactose phosphotransferase WbaP